VGNRWAVKVQCGPGGRLCCIGNFKTAREAALGLNIALEEIRAAGLSSTDTPNVLPAIPDAVRASVIDKVRVAAMDKCACVCVRACVWGCCWDSCCWLYTAHPKAMKEVDVKGLRQTVCLMCMLPGAEERFEPK
jgi:hypothetical protein